MITLELRKNYDGDLAEARGIVSKIAPVMGVYVKTGEGVIDVRCGTIRQVSNQPYDRIVDLRRK